MFPALTLRTRAQADGVLPLSQPLVTLDGKTLSELYVPRGTEIFIGTYASNVNKDIWGPDALEWKPERWAKLPPAVAEARLPGVYSHLWVLVCSLSTHDHVSHRLRARLTFMAGRRACM